jgi:AraC family transcriptional regulator
LQSDAGLVLPSGTPIPDGLGTVLVPAGRYITTMHVGPYEHLPDTWSRLLGEWLPASGLRIKEGPSIEIYRNTPMTAPKEQLITEIYVPIA